MSKTVNSNLEASARIPYPFQEEVSRRLLAGKSLALQAPTGSGKTDAALQPFFRAWQASEEQLLPSKCIYIVPMRVLAHQFLDKYRDKTGLMSPRLGRTLDVRIQTGDQQDDRRFEGDLIFCTVDQFLSSYLTMPYSLSRRMANINAGAMVGAYLVFDEFHLLDPGSTLPSVLCALRQLRPLAPVLLMTATFSGTMLEQLANLTGAEVLAVSSDEARLIETRHCKFEPRQRRWETAMELLSAEAVLDAHKLRTLVLCNTVREAQALYRELRQSITDKALPVDTLLLHGRFLIEDRRRIETELRNRLGEKAEHDGSLIVVATQAIEVGVDISCDTLHTQVAPASSLIQRAGRCARFPAEIGRVIVYSVEKTSPYEGDQAREMSAGWEWLQHQVQGESHFDFQKEQEFVEAVAAPSDRKVLQDLSAGQPMRANAILTVLTNGGQAADQRLLVRDADSRLVLIHPEPDLLLDRPYQAVGFNVPVTTLYGLVAEWREREDLELEWRVKYLIDSSDPDEDNRTIYDWRELRDRGQLAGTGVIVVNPALAGYLPDEGFLPT
ncbi:MAG: CRISPR-associated helicase Cas3', partial [Candidatus Promineifilaceae bacterium]